jgi:very-short-patch-repair endonuclease
MLNEVFEEEKFLDIFFVDFYLPEKNLVIEVNGLMHYLTNS